MRKTREPVRIRKGNRGSVLNPALVPTPLIRRDERQPIRIERSPVALRWRGATVLAALFVLTVRLTWLKLRGRLDSRALGQHLSAFCLRMGVLWIKVAQLMSMRVDLFAPEVIEELSRLQDRASGFPGAEAIKVIEEDLGAPLERYFTEFDAVPFAAASISQVHRGRLKEDGFIVAIKVRRPGVERTFASDMAVLRAILWLVEALSIQPSVGWGDVLWEAERIIQEELDYRIEATNQRRLRRSLRRHDVYVPKVFGDLCSSRVLVMEYVEGVLMSDYLRVARADRIRLAAWHDTNDVDPWLVARRLVRTFLRQLLEDNLFHSDLHPGNLVLLRGGGLAFLDFGSLGTTERELLRRYELHLDALVSGQHAAAVDLVLLFARNLPPTDLTPVKQELVEGIQAWFRRTSATGLSYETRSASVLSDYVASTLHAHGISLNWAFLRIGRAWTTIDASLRELAPNRDLRPVMVKYFRRRDQRARAALLDSLSESPEPISLIDLPRLLYERGIFRGSIVRRLAQVFEGSTTVAARLVARVFGALALAQLLAAIALLGVFLYQHHPAWIGPLMRAGWPAPVRTAPRLDQQVCLLILLVLAYGWRTARHVGRRFATEIVVSAGERR